ncbi:MAG: recombinase family protein [Oscillospiraceae bacterium]
MNERGMKTKRGRAFGKNSIYDILSNEKYCGTYVYNRAEAKIGTTRNSHSNKLDKDIIRIEDGVPAIISKEAFLKVQDILNKRSNKSASSKAK